MFWDSLGYKPWHVVETQGHSGGLWILSIRDDIAYTIVDSMTHAVTFSLPKHQAVWFYTAVHAPPNLATHKPLWDYLVTLGNIVQYRAGLVAQERGFQGDTFVS